MKVLELLDELEDIIDTSAGFPLTGKVLVDAEEVMELLKEIRAELPGEIQQAQWIKDERQRILDEAKKEHETILKDARLQAESLIENDDITLKAKTRAAEMLRLAEATSRNLKMGTFEYIDSILYNFQEKMDKLNTVYFEEMFNNLQRTFDQVNGTLTSNRNEIKELIYKTQVDAGEK
jgi:cell division septum initiation protein DivIVA